MPKPGSKVMAGQNIVSKRGVFFYEDLDNNLTKIEDPKGLLKTNKSGFVEDDDFVYKKTAEGNYLITGPKRPLDDPPGGMPRSPAAIKKKYGDTPKGRAALKAARKRADRGSPKPSNVKRERVFRDKSEQSFETGQGAAITDLYKAGMSFGPLGTTEYLTGSQQPKASIDKLLANKYPYLSARRYPTDPTPVKADATQKPPPPKDNRRGRGRPPRISTTADLKEEMASVQRERQRKLKRKRKKKY